MSKPNEDFYRYVAMNVQISHLEKCLSEIGSLEGFLDQKTYETTVARYTPLLRELQGERKKWLKEHSGKPEIVHIP